MAEGRKKWKAKGRSGSETGLSPGPIKGARLQLDQNILWKQHKEAGWKLRMSASQPRILKILAELLCIAFWRP